MTDVFTAMNSGSKYPKMKPNQDVGYGSFKFVNQAFLDHKILRRMFDRDRARFDRAEAPPSTPDPIPPTEIVKRVYVEHPVEVPAADALACAVTAPQQISLRRMLKLNLLLVFIQISHSFWRL